jgi:outer membrane protein OmpA-like peptidoglycan-associated protein
MPVDVWDDGTLPTRQVEGVFSQEAWRIQTQALTTLQILRPLREQLRNARFQVLFECQTEACGGFDFRFGTETLPPPQMQINIGDFRFLAAERRGDDGPEYVSLFVSRTAQAGFVQVTRVRPEEQEAQVSSLPSAPAVVADPANLDLEAQLARSGRAILVDLTFATGSAQLDAGEYPSLVALADYLRRFPARKVALVGHTDSSGSLAANIALSKQRAGSVLERLVDGYGVPRQQLEAEGMGYLAPIAPNLTEEGRDANRRVEVIITSLEE